MLIFQLKVYVLSSPEPKKFVKMYVHFQINFISSNKHYKIMNMLRERKKAPHRLQACAWCRVSQSV